MLAMDSTASNDHQYHTKTSKFSYVASLSLNQAWSRVGEQQRFYLRQNIEQTFTANRSNSSFAEGEIFLGIQQDISSWVQAQLGLAYQATGNVNLEGNIWDDADPAYNNYSYAYQVSHQHAAVKLKLLIDMKSVIRPYVSGSLGIGYNTSHSYHNTATIPEAIANPNFANKTISDFTYTLGLGGQMDMTTHTSIGFGYEFASWGKSQLGRAPAQTVNTGLVLNNLCASALSANLTYVY